MISFFYQRRFETLKPCNCVVTGDSGLSLKFQMYFFGCEIKPSFCHCTTIILLIIAIYVRSLLLLLLILFYSKIYCLTLVAYSLSILDSIQFLFSPQLLFRFIHLVVPLTFHLLREGTLISLYKVIFDSEYLPERYFFNVASCSSGVPLLHRW